MRISAFEPGAPRRTRRRFVISVLRVMGNAKTSQHGVFNYILNNTSWRRFSHCVVSVVPVCWDGEASLCILTLASTDTAGLTTPSSNESDPLTRHFCMEQQCLCNLLFAKGRTGRASPTRGYNTPMILSGTCPYVLCMMRARCHGYHKSALPCPGFPSEQQVAAPQTDPEFLDMAPLRARIPSSEVRAQGAFYRNSSAMSSRERSQKMESMDGCSFRENFRS